MFTSFIIKEMCMWNPWKLPMEPKDPMELSLNTTDIDDAATVIRTRTIN
jgi:hypothetical protein